MKNKTLYTVVTIMVAALINAQFALAVPADEMPGNWSKLQAAPIYIVPSSTEDGDDRDDEYEVECELVFPLCEANLQ